MTLPSTRKLAHTLVVAVVLVLAFEPIASIAKSSDDDGHADQEAFGITSTFGKWPLGFIPYVYDPTGAPAGFTDEIMEAVFADAIAEWDGYCGVLFAYGGVTDILDIDEINDGIVVFGWEDIGGASGQAGPAFGGVSTVWGHVVYGDGSFKLNPNIYDEIGNTPGEVISNALSIRETSAHELGHLLGHGHSDRPDSLMYSNPYNSISHTMESDIEACRKMYGYSTAFDPVPLYAPPGAGTNTYAQLFLTSNVDFPNNALATDDGMTYADSDFLLIGYVQTSGGYDDDLVTVVVDPLGRAALGSSENVVEDACCIYTDPLLLISQLREIPGLWTFYTYDDSGLLFTSTINVTTSLPAVNEPPISTFTFSEDVSTRSISVTTEIASDPDGDQVSIDWHIPTVGQVPIALQNAPLNDTQNVSLNPDGFDWEVFADIRDDHTRYTEDLPNNIGPAGPGFHDLHRYYASPWDMGPDLNGDNYSDIALRNSATSQNWLFTMAGNLIKSSEYVSTVSSPGWQTAGNGDFNKDGRHDQLWWNSISGQLWLHLMNGKDIETSTAVATYDPDWRVVGNGDYNNDGTADILMRSISNGQIRVLIMNGTAVSSNEFVRNLNTAWMVVGNGDYNGDGTSDILIRHSVTGQNWMFLMNGSTILPASGPVNTVSNLNSLPLGDGDYNGDGMADVLWYNTVTGKGFMYLMNGTTIQDWDVLGFINTDYTVVGDGDYNGDSFADILLYDTVTGQLRIVFMSGLDDIANEAVGTISNLDWSVINNN